MANTELKEIRISYSVSEIQLNLSGTLIFDYLKNTLTTEYYPKKKNLEISMIIKIIKKGAADIYQGISVHTREFNEAKNRFVEVRLYG